MLTEGNPPMKSTLFASTLAAGLTATSFGQVDVFPIVQCCAPWDLNWDGTTLSFFQTFDCYGYTQWDFFVYEETTVTYQLERLPCMGEPFVDSLDPFGLGQFATIRQDWGDLGGPTTWSGTFTLEPGIYDGVTFLEFQGTLTFGSGCEAGTDTDGDGVDDCDDGCPEDPFKSAPGDCGCGVEDLDSDKDGVADCKDGCPTDPNKTDPGTCGCGVSDEDSDGDGAPECIDNCPDDPNKSEPGNCGCGVPETDVFGDLDCDGDYDIDDIRLGMTTFGIEEAEEDTCPADVDGDGSIGFSDVLIILNDWGACP